MKKQRPAKNTGENDRLRRNRRGAGMGENDMLTTIQNDTITVSAETLGAELQSIRSAEGMDYLWDGSPSCFLSWGRSGTSAPPARQGR